MPLLPGLCPRLGVLDVVALVNLPLLGLDQLVLVRTHHPASAASASRHCRAPHPIVSLSCLTASDDPRHLELQLLLVCLVVLVLAAVAELLAVQATADDIIAAVLEAADLDADLAVDQVADLAAEHLGWILLFASTV
eukprot:2409597-Pyramimonas_sp.AAC.1